MDFGLERFDLSKLTRKIQLPDISADPDRPVTLIVRAANLGNVALRNEVIRRDAAKKAAETPPPPDAQALAAAPPAKTEAEAIADDAALLAGTVLVGWENVTAAGAPVPFTPEAARDLIIQLRTHVPDLWDSQIASVIYQGPALWRTTADPVELGKG
ncbi:MAG TPA: hypothetical protein VFQ42_22335 [Mycobacterium sp.]|nr:hypothetical protein [Mycobacterium sp.]